MQRTGGQDLFFSFSGSILRWLERGVPPVRWNSRTGRWFSPRLPTYWPPRVSIGMGEMLRKAMKSQSFWGRLITQENKKRIMPKFFKTLDIYRR